MIAFGIALFGNCNCMLDADVIIWINGAECSAIMECHGVRYEQTVQAGEDTFIFEKMKL